MKLIHTYWSKPTYGTNDNLLENRYDGGWFSMKYHCLSWALSCLKCKQFYDNVELYTDKAGKELLIDKLQLPYSRVHVCLDDLNYVPKQMWAMSKIYTYSLQNDPFIHIDGDVFIWKKFEKELENASLVAQNIERFNSYYKFPMRHMYNRNFKIPDVLANIELSDICAVNAGILGGNNISFFKDYTQQALEILNSNIKKFNHKDAGRLNVVIEQLLFYRIAQQQNLDITYLLEDVKEDFSDLMQFTLVPKQKSYIHLVGFAKRILYACNMVERHLQYEFPEYYQFFSDSFITNTATNQYIPSRKININSLFKNSISAIHFYLANEKPSMLNDLDSILEAIHKLSNVTSKKMFSLILETFEFEKNQFMLLADKVSYINEMMTFDYFCGIKEFLVDYSKDEIINMRFKLSGDVRVGAYNFNIPIIISQENWFEQKTDKIRRGEFVYVFTRPNEETTKYSRLNGYDMLLYYLSYNPMTGNEMVQMLQEDEILTEKPLLVLRDEVFNFIANNLLYTGFIEVDK